MMTKNVELMRMAKESLKGKWGLAAVTFLVYILLSMASSIVPVVGPLLVGGPLALGLALFILSISRGQEADIAQLFKGFERFVVAFVAMLLITLFVSLACLLLIVPGIILGIAYSMTFFILLDNPDLTAVEAMKKSRELMYGFKWKFFCLSLRFIGWFLLCVITFGIASLWITPYLYVSYAKFYDDLLANKNVAQAV
ncbi:MAG: DUF975 family protein [Bacteroidota bacterium]|nr:DUF975 family protein [Bacteroidota bacterium]HHU95880.1 DUF975 family protein [Petrimonas sp.]